MTVEHDPMHTCRLSLSAPRHHVLELFGAFLSLTHAIRCVTHSKKLQKFGLSDRWQSNGCPRTLHLCVPNTASAIRHHNAVLMFWRGAVMTLNYDSRLDSRVFNFTTWYTRQHFHLRGTVSHGEEEEDDGKAGAGLCVFANVDLNNNSDWAATEWHEKLARNYVHSSSPVTIFLLIQSNGNEANRRRDSLTWQKTTSPCRLISHLVDPIRKDTRN